MSTKRWIRCRGVSGLVALSLCVAATRMLAGQGAAPSKEQADDAAGFKEFSTRVQAYVKLQKTVESSLPALKPTDLPEMITAHQQVLARKIREARPHAKSGDIFTPAACEAFCHASRAALAGPALGQLTRVHAAGRAQPEHASGGERDLPGHRADHGPLARAVGGISAAARRGRIPRRGPDADLD